MQMADADGERERLVTRSNGGGGRGSEAPHMSEPHSEWSPRATLCESVDATFGSVAMGQNRLHAEWPACGDVSFALLCVYYALWSVADSVALWVSQRHAHDHCDQPLALWLVVSGSVGLAYDTACVIALVSDWWHVRDALARRRAVRGNDHALYERGGAPLHGFVRPDSFANHLHVWLLRKLLFGWLVTGSLWIRTVQRAQHAVPAPPTLPCNSQMLQFALYYAAFWWIAWVLTALPLAVNLLRPAKKIRSSAGGSGNSGGASNADHSA